MRETLRLSRHYSGIHGEFFRVAPFATLFGDTEDFVTDLEVGHARAERADDARKIPPGYVGKLGGRRIVARAHLPVGGVHAGRMHLDEHLARAGHGIRNIAILHHLRSTVLHEVGSFHRSLFLAGLPAARQPDSGSGKTRKHPRQ